jgi:hypothetical protein
VINHVHAGIQSVYQALGRQAVGSGELAKIVCLINYRAKLVDAIGRPTVIGDGRGSSRCHDLDVVRALFDQLANRDSNIFYPVGFLVAPMEVSAGEGNRATTEQEAGRSDVASPGTFTQVEGDAVAGAVLSQSIRPGRRCPLGKSSARTWGPSSKEDCPRRSTALMVDPSTTTAAFSRGLAPVPSITVLALITVTAGVVLNLLLLFLDLIRLERR